MAASAFTISDKARLNYLSATNLLGANPANFKLSLHASGWTPNVSTAEVKADATNELSTGNGYTSGGVALTGVTLTQTGATVKFTSSPAVWTASGGSIPAWRTAVAYYNGTLNGKVNPIVGWFVGDNTPADIPATTDGNTLTVTMNANGIVAAS